MNRFEIGLPSNLILRPFVLAISCDSAAMARCAVEPSKFTTFRALHTFTLNILSQLTLS